jgi:hypothetical protein
MIGCGFGFAGFLALLLSPSSPFFPYIAYSFDLRSFDSKQVSEVAAPLISDAYIAHPNRIQWWGRKVIYWFSFQLRGGNRSGFAFGKTPPGRSQSGGSAYSEKVPAFQFFLHGDFSFI